MSVAYPMAAHKCCCGCENEVITPLSPTDWKLIFDGKTISLHPSIGNWGFECRSHYWINRNRIDWAGQWSQEQIEAGRLSDQDEKERYFGTAEAPRNAFPSEKLVSPASDKQQPGFWSAVEHRWLKIKQWWLNIMKRL